MYTVEFEHDEIAITIMDDNGVHGDIKVRAYDDIVYITQDDEDLDVEFILEMSPHMWEELMTAIHSKEGFFKRV
jgi:hypothetical protein